MVTNTGGYKMNGFKVAGLLLFALFSSVLAAGFASAADVPVQVSDVWVDGDKLDWNTTNELDIEKGQKLDIRVKLTAFENDDYIQVKAKIRGFEYDDRFDTEDVSHSFDVEANTTYDKYLEIEVPELMDNDGYKLRITVTNRDDDQNVYYFDIRVRPSRHLLKIKDIDFFPENGVEAGKSFQTKVRIGNIGGRDEESVKITVSVPELGISASDYIDMIEADDTESSEEIWIRVPECVESGFYEAVVKVSYDELYESVSKSKALAVTGDICQPAAADAPDESEESGGTEFVPGPSESESAAGGDTGEEKSRNLLRNALEIGLVGIIIALVILGLVIGAAKLLNSKEF